MAEERASSLGLDNLTEQGYALIGGVLDPDRVRSLQQTFEAAASGSVSGSQRAGSVYALRNVPSLAAVQSVASSPAVRGLVEPILGPDAFIVRGIFFDKTPEANWNVPWHQDLSITVQKRYELPGWGPWSEKAGVLHVQPPTGVLERMLTLRLHLDDCPAENGALRVLPGTHRRGRLNAAEIARLREEIPEQICGIGSGGALLMRPLLLHASSAAQLPGHRRVLHLEWAAEPLPDGLAWQLAT